MEKPLLSLMPSISVKVSGVADLMLKAALVSSAIGEWLSSANY
jgi:hypothetical protein